MLRGLTISILLNICLVVSIWLMGPFLLIRKSSLTTLAANLEKWQPLPSISQPPFLSKTRFSKCCYGLSQSALPALSHSCICAKMCFATVGQKCV